MVALEPRPPFGLAGRPARGGRLAWSLASAGVLVVGLSLRLGLGAGGVGDRSGLVMASILCVGVWLGALLLTTPRVACLVAFLAVVFLDLGALPARNEPEYDDRQAFFGTDQVVSVRVPVLVQTSLARPQSEPVLDLLVEPVYPPDASQPRFGLAGTVGGSDTLAWHCAFRRGLQHLALALPPATLAGATRLDIRLHLTGSPSRESDYLVVYASAPRGGFVASVVPTTATAPGTTPCSLDA